MRTNRLARAEALLDVRFFHIDIQVPFILYNMAFFFINNSISFHFVRFDVLLLDVKVGICLTSDALVGLHDVLDLDVSKVVERVQVLLDQSLDLQECWQQLPLFLHLPKND